MTDIMKKFNKIGIYAGSFDPLSLGHLDIIRRCTFLFDKVIVAIGTNSSKNTLFSLEERISLIKESYKEYKEKYKFVFPIDFEVTHFSGLLVDFAKSIDNDDNLISFVRGIRNSRDFEYEVEIANINRHISGLFDTVCLIADPANTFISSSAVKEVAKYHGNLEQFVTPCVRYALSEKFSKL